MDPAGIGALIGVGIMGFVYSSISVYHYCKKKPAEINPLLVRHRSSRPKNLFSHVEI